jgi:dipeptidyl aminopeptidase/acylaminoacyl peptidase
MNRIKQRLLFLAFGIIAAAGFAYAGTPVAATATDSALTMERIFLKPYIAGTRPEGVEISPDEKFILYRWDDKAGDEYRRWMMNADGSGNHRIPDTLAGDFAWSPDLHTIACTRKGNINLTDTSFRAFTPLTRLEDGAYDLRWTPDGKRLAFVWDNKILTLTPSTGELLEIAHASGKNAWIRFIDFTPDSKRVLYGESNHEGLKEYIIPKYTGKEVTTSTRRAGIGTTKLYLTSIDSGSTVALKIPGDDKYFAGETEISPDGKYILLGRVSSDHHTREIFCVETDSGKATKVYEEKDPAWVEDGLIDSHWLPDGKHFVVSSEKEGWNHLYKISRDGKDSEWLTKGDWEIHWWAVDSAGKKIYFQANKDDHHQWQLYALDLETKEIRKLSTREGTYEDPQLSKRGSFIVAMYSDFDKPAEMVEVPTGTTGAELQLTHTVPEEFQRIKWTVPEIVHFKARDGVEVPAMIYKPAHFDSTRKYPVVVFVHGAGYAQNVYRVWSYYYREYMFNHRLAQNGYVVYEVEYRGSAGYGRNFRADVYMHLGGKDLQDELDGIDYLNSLGYIDTSRVGIYGGSYGGFLALMGMFCSQKYACGAALRAVTSWENYYDHNPWYTEARLGKPEDHPDAYKISSPITYADSLKKPLLILHGVEDDNVFFQDAVQLIAKLQKAKKKFEVMMYPDESHSFTQPESWYDEYSRIEEFFNRNLKGSQ